MAVFDAPGANAPPAPRTPRRVDCVDGDVACDADGARNGRCAFDLRACVNSTSFAGECTPDHVDSVVVRHAVDDGDPRFDVDFQSLQQRIDQLGFPDNETSDDCSLPTSISVTLGGPDGNGKMMTRRKTVRLAAEGLASGRTTPDRDRMRFTCRPEGDAVYSPRELYEGTFDRIRRQIFEQRCALSGCHDSETHRADMILLPNAAYSQIVGVAPTSSAAAADGLMRITPGDPALSFLYRKITGDLLPGYGSPMPLTGPALAPALKEIIRLWILGDGVTGPAPETGWVDGTDG